MLRVGELIAKGVPAEQIDQEVDAGFRDGQFSSPKKTGIAYMLKGDLEYDQHTQAITRMTTPPHYMIYAPQVTNMDIGVDPTRPQKGFTPIWVYDGYSGGTRVAYIMVLAAKEGPEHAH
jgi:hypothetical protein